MHLPHQLISEPVSIASHTLAALALAGAGLTVLRTRPGSKAVAFAAVSTWVFAAQMINFPILPGVSGHLMGGVLAAAMLGVPLGMLSIALVLVIQCLFFGDGGLDALGANVINLSILGAGLGGWALQRLRKLPKLQSAAPAFAVSLACLISLGISSLSCALMIAFSGAPDLGNWLLPFIGVHALIGLAEAAITLAALEFFSAPSPEPALDTLPKLRTKRLWACSIVTAMLLSPLASSAPDGLEWVAGRFGFMAENTVLFFAPLADYRFPVIHSEGLSTVLAALAGLILTATFAWTLAQLPRMGETKRIKTRNSLA
jgi:cobalt/nickel transport system permease protein